MIFSAKLSRYLLVVTFIIVVSIVLPKFYSMLFYKSYNGPRVYFSPISEIFLLTKYNGKEVIRVDKSGKIYSREEFESLTPLFNYRQLLYRNEMPDSIKGILIDIQDVKLNNVFFSIKPSDIFRYLVPLNPLIESAPGRPDIQMPKEFFRIDDKMEFINCKTNEIDEDFSNLFNNKLFENEFSFPAKGIYGNPTTKKPFDEGYFVIDKSNNLFHIKQINNMPFVRKVEIPKGIKIDYIYLKESNLKEFYVLFITNENKIFIVSYDDYNIIETPSEGYDRKEMQLVFMGNKFYRELNFISNNHIKTIVTDRSYKTIDIYEETWKTNKDYLVGDLTNYLFPFQLSLTNNNNLFVGFYLKFSDFRFLITNSLLAIIFFIYQRKQVNKFGSKQLFDFVIILSTGFYGILALLIIKEES